MAKGNEKKEIMIKEIFDLIAEGDVRINKDTENGILILGRTGAGKSTLANLLTKKSLKARIDQNTGDMLIESIDSPENFKISHKAASETKIPNGQEYRNVTIWDCPGFKDTGGIVQEIANTFYIRRLFETTKNLKFILVMPDSVLLPEGIRGGVAISIIEQFGKIFKDISVLEDKVTLVVTSTPNTKKDTHIKNSLDKIVNENNLVQEKPNVKQIIEYLKKSIQLFPKPTEEGTIQNSNIFDEIESNTKYLKTNVELISVVIENDSIIYAKELLDTSKTTLTRLTNIFKTIINNTDKNSNINEHNTFINSLASIKELIPKTLNASIKVDLNKDSHNITHFKCLDLLAELKITFEGAIDNKTESVKSKFVEILNVFEKFAQPNLKAIIQKYIHIFKQQIEFIKFLSDACAEGQMDYTQIIQAIGDSKNVLNNKYELQIQTIVLDPNNQDIGYYTKAIKYLDLYPNNDNCIENKAQCFYHISLLHEKTNNLTSALSNYIQALKLNENLGQVYEKVGDILIVNKDYTKAIKCYKVANNFIKVRDCYDELIKQNPQDSVLRFEKAEYYFSIGLFPKAHGYYQEALSLTKDDNYKIIVLQKISETFSAQSQKLTSKAQEYSQKANAQEFYNTDLMNIAELENYCVNFTGDAHSCSV